jgi:hypothetical protein
MSGSTPCVEPAPVGDCDVCAALLRQREEARARGDHRTVWDWNNELRNHPHRRADDWK